MISIWLERSKNLFNNMARSLALFLVLFFAASLRAQTLGDEVPAATLEKYGLYDLDRLPPSFHAGRRTLVLDSMDANSVALFTAATEKTRANDITYEFHQDPNFYYLTGCLEPESALLLLKEPVTIDGKSVREILFVRDRNPAQETWTGHRLGPEGAMQILKPELALSIDTLSAILHTVLPRARVFYYSPRYGSPRDPVLDDSVLVQDSVVRNSIVSKYPNLTIDNKLRRTLAALRAIKTTNELRLMRRAITISNEAHNAVIHDARPGWHEYEIQALAESIFTKNGSEYTAYPCIVGSGPNSTILHYETNRRETKPGEFIEMDMGSEYHGYTADVTRSFPISGHFTPEQRAIYELVLEAQDSGIRLCKAGNPFRSAHGAAVRVITRGLLRLGIITDSSDYKRYFMHGTSHYLGLDVHDAGLYGPLEPGNVLTVEPGIYIAEGSPCDKKWWNIGCRIEDDILVTDRGPENLSAGSPRTVAALEKMMSRSHP
jgi:Xaa-Pro aminopeptidase